MTEISDDNVSYFAQQNVRVGLHCGDNIRKVERGDD